VTKKYFKKTELKHLHKDGYRVRLVERDAVLLIYVVLVAKGRTIRRKRVWRCEPKHGEPISDHYPEWDRRGKLLAATLRSFNEGASLEEVRDAFLATHKVRSKFAADVTADMQLAAVQSEEAHRRTFRLPNGNYLCVAEDEYAEELDPLQMQQLMDEVRVEEDGSDPLGLFQ
jgi:hypothetical protein